MVKFQFCEPKQSTKPQNNREDGYYCELVLLNDDHNTFDYVIDCLIEVCGHTAEQAEQCAYLTHYRGSCKIASGTVTEIQKMEDELTERGLKVKIAN